MFDVNAWIFNPFILMFISVASGIAIGEIKFGKFNLGVSGTLFTGLAIGWFIIFYANGIAPESNSYKTAQLIISNNVIIKEFFTLFLMIFIAAVGLLAAKDIKVVLKKYGLKFIMLGFFITFIGALTTYGMTIAGDKFFHVKSNAYEVSGVYTGALTSSPGLAAAIETARMYSKQHSDDFKNLSKNEKEDILNMVDKNLDVNTAEQLTESQQEKYVSAAQAGIGIGHAVGYPFGVIIVILAINFFPKIFRINLEDEIEAIKHELVDDKKHSSNAKKINIGHFDLVAFCLAMIIGYTVGAVKFNFDFIGLGTISLGATGGVLIMSLFLGYIGKIGPLNFRMDERILGALRQISLAFFLAIVGLRYGYLAVTAFSQTGVYLIAVAIVVCLVSVVLGFVVGRYVFKINWVMLSGALCGGMTSTPGLGAAVDAVGNDLPAAGYGAAYPFALIGMVIFTIMLHHLPI